MNYTKVTKAELIEDHKRLKNLLQAKESLVKDLRTINHETKERYYKLEEKKRTLQEHTAFLILNQVSELKMCAHLLHPFVDDTGITHNEKRYRAKLAINTIRKRIVYLTEAAITDIKKTFNQFVDEDLPF